MATCGQIAKLVGNKYLASRIGKILNQNPNPIVVPCHRIIHSTEIIGGYPYRSKKKIDHLIKGGHNIKSRATTTLKFTLLILP